MKITKKDFDNVVDSVKSELASRKRRRKELEEQWDEVDRQVSMKLRKREDLPGTRWMPNIELPLQAQALEVLTADAERLRFPEERDWFAIHSRLTDDFLMNIERQSSISGVNYPMGLERELVNKWTQGDVDELVASILIHYPSKYDFRGAISDLDAQAFKYGTYVGYVKEVNRSVYTKEFRGVYREDEQIPVLIPGDIRKTYLDDSCQEAMKEGQIIAPSIIREYTQKATDIVRAAKGTGGWVKNAVSKLDPSKPVDVIEFMGDFVAPRSQGTIFAPNMIITIGQGMVIRIRDIDTNFRPVVHGNYHREDLGPYGASPLMKGAPIHRAATEAANRLLQAVILQTEPPVVYDPNDQYLVGMGGPIIEPRAQWRAMSDPKPVFIGDPTGLMQVYLGLLKQYEDLTGVTAPRLGAQTKSHQTAFAIDAEMTRGQTRTVDYVNGNKPVLATVLHMELEYLRKRMPKTSVYMQKYGGYVDVDNTYIPDNVYIDVLGTSAPLADREREQREFAAVQMMLQMEPMVRQLGGRPLDLDKFREEIARRANPTFDIDSILSDQNGPAMQGVPASSPTAANILSAAG